VSKTSLSSASAPVVRFLSVSKNFGRRLALRGLSVDFPPGLNGLLGPNGAGKTTALRILATLIEPSRGTVEVGGLELSSPKNRRAVRGFLGYLPQEAGVYERFTVTECIEYFALLKQVSGQPHLRRVVDDAISALGLTSVRNEKVRVLSGGMRRRVAIAQAIVGPCLLLLLDEPTAGLDPEQRIVFRDLIGGLAAERTVILSTHLVEDIAALCDTVTVLAEGQLLFAGSPSQLSSAADGHAWLSSSKPPDALAGWRTEGQRYRYLAAGPQPGATPVAPTMEDGFLLLLAESRRQLD
jgi:ABC-2 type transport system ATP-binding protein